MKTFWVKWDKPSLSPKNLCLSLGGFDGVHLGHQSLIKRVVQQAKRNKVKSALLVFDPLPFQVLKNIKPFKRLLTLNEMSNFLSQLGLDYFCIMPFNKKISKIEAKNFVESFLIPHFKPQHIVLGYDFSFAHQKKGNFLFLKPYQKKYGFGLEEAPAFQLEKQVISSSLIRQHLKQAEIRQVNKQLGYSFFIEATVQKGEGRARELGFPTANLVDESKQKPCFGVYKATVKIENSPKKHKALVNIGCRPTFYKNKKVLVEAHILNFNQDLYGKNLKLELKDFVRKEKKFKSSEDLKKQILKDIKKT